MLGWDCVQLNWSGGGCLVYTSSYFCKEGKNKQTAGETSIRSYSSYNTGYCNNLFPFFISYATASCLGCLVNFSSSPPLSPMGIVLNRFNQQIHGHPTIIFARCCMFSHVRSNGVYMCVCVLKLNTRI